MADLDKLVKIVGSRIPSIDILKKQGEWWTRLFVEHGILKPGMRILDFGAGLGRLAIPFSKIAKVTALDVNPDMVKYMTAHGVDAYVATDCKVVKGPFDFIISAFVFQHNPIEDVQILISQMDDLTDTLYFTYPMVEEFNGNFPKDYKHYLEWTRLPIIDNTQTSRMMYRKELPVLFETSTFDSKTLTRVEGIGTNLFRVTKA